MTPDAPNKSLTRWVIVLFIAIILEGALRKWVLPSQFAPVAYILKDLIATAFLFRFPIPRMERRLNRAAIAIIVLGLTLAPWYFAGAHQSLIAPLQTLKHIVLWPLFAIHLLARSRMLNMRLIEITLAVFAIGI